MVKIDDRTFRMETKEPLPILDYLMANILITPAKDNKPEELQRGVGSGPYVVTEADRGTGTYLLDASANYWGAKPRSPSAGPVPAGGIKPRGGAPQR